MVQEKRMTGLILAVLLLVEVIGCGGSDRTESQAEADGGSSNVESQIGAGEGSSGAESQTGADAGASVAMPQAESDVSDFEIEDGYLLSYQGTDTDIVIPEGVTSIENDAFGGCDSLTIYVKEGSYVQEYANENGIPFQALEP